MCKEKRETKELKVVNVDNVFYEVINCAKCKAEKPVFDFYSKQKNCKECAKESMRQYRVDTLEKTRIYENSRYLSRFNDRNDTDLTATGLLELRSKQKNSCAICKQKNVDFNRKLHIDHCHETNIIRGLLCFKCNIGLGWFKDNVARMQEIYTLKISNKADADKNGLDKFEKNGLSRIGYSRKRLKAMYKYLIEAKRREDDC